MCSAPPSVVILMTASAYLEVARGIIRRGDDHRHARVALDILELHVALHAVDDDVLAVGVHPSLRNLGRTVLHQSGDIAGAWLAQQRQQFFSEFYHDYLIFLLFTWLRLSRSALPGKVDWLLPLQGAHSDNVSEFDSESSITYSAVNPRDNSRNLWISCFAVDSSKYSS